MKAIAISWVKELDILHLGNTRILIIETWSVVSLCTRNVANTWQKWLLSHCLSVFVHVTRVRFTFLICFDIVTKGDARPIFLCRPVWMSLISLVKGETDLVHVILTINRQSPTKLDRRSPETHEAWWKSDWSPTRHVIKKDSYYVRKCRIFVAGRRRIHPEEKMSIWDMNMRRPRCARPLWQ